jgi:O-acetyl-ADP-ribose deacetylase (regulator of RNase III)
MPPTAGSPEEVAWTVRSIVQVDRPSCRNAEESEAVLRGKRSSPPQGNLKARYVIHTVGPRYHDGTRNEAALLKSAYLESLRLASKKNLISISFPAISTGAYGYPVHEAARIALQTTIEYLGDHQAIRLVRFVLYHQSIYAIFAEELNRLI